MRTLAFIVLALLFAPLSIKSAAKVRFAEAGKEQPTSPWKSASLDFILPGYGSFVHKNYIGASLYFTANLATLASTYMAYRNWRFYDSAYRAAAQRQAAEPDALLFKDPAGSNDFLSLQDIRNRSERGQLFFTLSVVVNIVIRCFSAAETWSLSAHEVERAGPHYEVFYDALGAMNAQGSYRIVF